MSNRCCHDKWTMLLLILRSHTSIVMQFVIGLPTEHQGVRENSFRNVRAFQDRIGIWKCWFLKRAENRSTRRKTSRSRVENRQQTQPTYDAGSWNWTRATLVGSRRHCAIPVPQPRTMNTLYLQHVTKLIIYHIPLSLSL